MQGWTRFVSMQNHYNLSYREEAQEMNPFGKRLYGSEADFQVADAIAEVAQIKGVSRAQIGLAWLLSNTAVTAPIIGTTKLEHLEDAIKAVDVTLTEDEIAQLEAPYVPHAIAGHS